MESSIHEDEIKTLKETNNELVQKVQYFKMKATQCENDKLYLMKENNDLRLKLSRLQSAEAAHAQALESALQTSTEEALSHLVQASDVVARTMVLAKSYMRERQNLELSTVRWSTIGGTPGPPVREKVHKVAPMMMGGRSIQPFVSLDRIPLNNSSNATLVNQNQNVTERVLPLPMHILQDVYIPLRRIDASELLNLSAGNAQNQEDDPSIQEAEEQEEDARRESERVSEAPEYDDLGLNVINEESEMENDNANASSRSVENPLEGPSWLLDMPRGRPRDRVKFEPDSTTEVDESISNIDALRLSANQSQSQSPILEPRRPRSPETRRLENRAIPGCSQMRNEPHHRPETRSNTPTQEARDSSPRYATPKSNVTLRRHSPLCARVIKESPGFGDESQGSEPEGGTPAQLEAGAGSELNPSPQRLAFTPTVRRRRISPLAPLPAPSPSPAPLVPPEHSPSPAPPTLPAGASRGKARRNRKNSRSTSGNRILKVLVPKIVIDSLENSNSCDSRSNGNTPNAFETSNTETISKRIEIKLSRTEFQANASVGINESIATSNLSENASDIPLNLSGIASTSGVAHRQNADVQSDIDTVKKKGKGRSKSSRKGKECVNDSGDVSSAKRRALCKSPSPNGSTDSAMERESELGGQSIDVSGGSGGGGLRTRRQRNQVTYKEKPLNVKLRRI